MRYGAPFDLLRDMAFGILSDVTGVEFLGPQLAKDGSIDYAEAERLVRRRSRIVVYATAGLLTLVVLFALG